MSARLLAIGDIHGCDMALAALLALVQPTADDTLVVIGDVVDRGPGSKQAIDQLLQIQKTSKLVVIMGNHEELMRDALLGSGLYHAWLETGGNATLRSYGGSLADVPPAHIRFLTECVPFWEHDEAIFVHANLEPGVSLRNQSVDWLRWKHLGGSEKPHRSGKRVICGHTSQKDGLPWAFDGWVCIDTFAYGGQWLTCLDVATNDVFQANQVGEVRSFPLDRAAEGQ